MTKLLFIEASPRGENSYSSQVANEFLKSYSANNRKRYERPTEIVAFPARPFARALRFGLEQSYGTNSATFVGFGWR